MAVHQYTRFLADSKLSYKRVVTRIDRYLFDTLDRGIICKMNQLKEFEYFVDADFACIWNANDLLNPENVL